MLRVGDHFSLQVWTGPQWTIAPNRTNELIDGVMLGYCFTHRQIPLPLTESITPLLEFDGRQPFSGPGQDRWFGTVGVLWKSAAEGRFQPGVSVGYEFPLGQNARDQLRWGFAPQVLVGF